MTRTILSLAENNSVLKIVNDQFGSPTYTKDLADAMCKLIKTKSYGTFHITNNGVCTWYEFAKRLMEYKGIKTEINPCTTEEYPRPAKRPAYSALENYKFKLCGFDQLRHFTDALKAYLKETQ